MLYVLLCMQVCGITVCVTLYVSFPTAATELTKASIEKGQTFPTPKNLGDTMQRMKDRWLEYFIGSGFLLTLMHIFVLVL